MGFHKRGDEESSVQEDSCGKTILAHGSAIRVPIGDRNRTELEYMTEREKDDELHRTLVHMQFICRMYKLQHDEGRYFLHEHCQGELPWRKDCVEEIQEMTGAKLMSVNQGSRSPPLQNQERKEGGTEREAHSDGDQMFSHCFHPTSFCEGSPPPKQKTPQTSRKK